MVEHVRAGGKAQNQLSDLRAFRVVEALHSFAGGKTRLSPDKVFPSLAELESFHEGDTESEEELLESFDQMRTVMAAASCLPMAK